MSENSERFLIQNTLPKAEKFCAYQERSIHEVKQKLSRLGISSDIQNKIIEILLEKDFINEDRFCELYIRSKINQNGWGPFKIIQELKNKNISEELIKKYMDAFPIEKHDEVLNKLIASKIRVLKEEDSFKKKQKLLRFAFAKGYSTDQINRVLRKHFD